MEIDAKGDGKFKANVRRFKIILFQQLLSEFIDIKGKKTIQNWNAPIKLIKNIKLSRMI